MKRVNLTDKPYGEKFIDLTKSNDMLVMRLKPDFRNFTAIKKENFFTQSGVQVVYDFGSTGSFIVKVTDGLNTNQVKNNIRNDPRIDLAGNAYLLDGQPVIYTGNIIIIFRKSESQDDCIKLLADNSLTIKQNIPELGNIWLVNHNKITGDKIFSICDDLLKIDEIEVCYPEIMHYMTSQTIHHNQWHLMPTRVDYTAYIDASANVAKAHKITKGAGVVVAIIDSGIDITHPEFSVKDKVVFPVNFNLKSYNYDPLPLTPDESHGTACAGVAVASGHYGASGVAPEAKLMPIRWANLAGGDFTESKTFIWAAVNGADIISCSWGMEGGNPLDPLDPRHSIEIPIYPLTKRAIDYAVTYGRDGKGCAIFFAAGNGNQSVDIDGHTNYPNVLAVAASNDKGQRSYYSNYGKAIFCAFPSDDILRNRTQGIWTTDISGKWGYNQKSVDNGDEYGNYTNSFGGTSSACPGAAGVAALVLSVNPELTLPELKEILRQSCDKIDPEHGQYDKNGHSIYYGYGRLNAEKAVLLAHATKKRTSQGINKSLA